MKLKISSLVLIFLFALDAVSQAPLTFPAQESTAPINWVLYRSGVDFSIELPKLPVRTDFGQGCDNKSSAVYHAYANHAVYEVRVTKRREPARYCPVKTGFGEGDLQARFEELRKTTPAPVGVSEADLGGRRATVFRWETASESVSRWIINDLPNERWFEMQINRRKDPRFDEMIFLRSLRIGSSEGVDIGEGALHTLGDAETTDGPAVPAGSPREESLLFISRPKARYTELARKNKIKGGVLMNVTFLPNGSIGNVEVLKPLPDGLTEEAIRAARRIVFLPRRIDGEPVAFARKFEYSFSIF